MDFSPVGYKRRIKSSSSILLSINHQTALLRTVVAQAAGRAQPTWYSEAELQPFSFLGGCWESCPLRPGRARLAESFQFFPSSKVCLTSALSAELRDSCRCLLGSQLFLPHKPALYYTCSLPQKCTCSLAKATDCNRKEPSQTQKPTRSNTFFLLKCLRTNSTIVQQEARPGTQLQGAHASLRSTQRVATGISKA